jgi:hypothetical protein
MLRVIYAPASQDGVKSRVAAVKEGSKSRRRRVDSKRRPDRSRVKLRRSRRWTAAGTAAVASSIP